MIVNEIFYGVKCDRCGELFEDGEHSFWVERNEAVENAVESEWIEKEGRHFCDNCYDIGPDDEIVVRAEYPVHLKTLIKFIDKVLGGTFREVDEVENIFSVKFRVHTNKFEDFERNYIKNLLGDNFISLEYEISKYGSLKCIITLKKYDTN